MTVTAEQRAPRLSVDGTVATAALLGRLVDLRIDRRLNLTGASTLRFNGSTTEVGIALGAKVEIKSSDGTGMFVGIVTAIEMERYDAQHRITTVTALDASAKMRHTSQAVTREQVTTSDVVSELAGAAGVSVDVQSTQFRFAYLLQNGTDLDYVDGMLAREGYDWWCEGETFTAKKLAGNGSATVTVKAPTLERLAVRASGVRPDTVKVRGWSIANEKVLAQAALGAEHLGGTGTMATAVLDAQGTVGQQVHNTATIPLVDQQEADNLAAAALVRATSAAMRVELEGAGLWKVGPATIIEVTDGDDANGTYLVTEVQHRFADGVGSSRVICGDRRPGGLTGATSTGALDPSAAVLGGIIVGIVTNIDDPDKKGRVRVRFPGLDDQQQSDWARVSSIAAGNGRGSSIRPEVNDEVLIAFEGGDLRKPIVLGSLYNARTAVPTLQLKGGKFSRATVLHQFGHQFLMWDEGDTAGIEIQLANGPTFIMNEKSITLKGGGNQETTIIEQGSSKIEMKTDGTITIKGKSITLQADGEDVVIKGNNVKATAQLGVKVEGGTTLELKGSASTKVESSGVTELKGSLVKIN